VKNISKYCEPEYWEKKYRRFCIKLFQLFFYPLRKFFFGEYYWSSKVMFGCEFRHRRKIYLGKKVVVSRGVVIHADSIDGIVLGNYSQLGPYTVLYGNIKIGKLVMVGPHVTMASANHGFSRLDIPILDQECTTKGEIFIEDDVWIGAGCAILTGVKIGTGSVIAAGSVVNKNVEHYSIMAGAPAKTIGSRKPSA
jgi:acetyltransferase-like isoleucine patch superfamily enzyme